MVIIILTIAALIAAAAYICYRLGFTVPQQTEADLFKFPDTEQYAPFREEMTAMVKAALAIPYEDVWITSGDGLKLHGKCYTSTLDAPVQIGIFAAGFKSRYRAASMCCWSTSVRTAKARASA